MRVPLICVIIFSLHTAAQAAVGAWREEVAIHPLDGGLNVLAHFQFTASSEADKDAFTTISPEIYKLVEDHEVDNLELTLVRGRWPASTAPPAWLPLPPPGLEIRVRFKESVNDTQTAFHALAHSLSALVAAAVPTLAEAGALGAPTVGWFGDRAVSRGQIYGALPSETPCVESVAAWLKLLPCRDELGLAALLRPDQVVATPLHALTVSVDRIQEGSPLEDCQNPSSAAAIAAQVIKIKLAATVIRTTDDTEWMQSRTPRESVWRLFRGGSQEPSECPSMAQHSTAILPADIVALYKSSGKCTAAAGSVHHVCSLEREGLEGGGLAPAPIDCRVASPEGLLNQWTLNAASRVVATSPLIGELQIAAKVQKKDTIMKDISNEGSEGPAAAAGSIVLHLVQVVPWEIPVRWHTLELSINGQPMSLTRDTPIDTQNEKNENDWKHSKIVWKVLRPATPRQHGSLLELVLQLPTENEEQKEWEVRLSVQVEKRLLSVFDLPPDASRGVDIPAAEVTLVPPPTAMNSDSDSDSGSESLASKSNVNAKQANAAGSLAARMMCGTAILRQRCAVHLINLPIPDASMPFNVVCFTSTAVAVSFGSMLNAVLVPPAEMGKAGAGGKTLKQRLRRVLVVLVLVGVAAVYMDRDLQRKVDGWVAIGENFLGIGNANVAQ